MESSNADTFSKMLTEENKLNPDLLPTYKDVMNHYSFVMNDLTRMSNGRKPAVTKVLKIVTSDVEGIWKNAQIPTILEKSIIKKIKVHREKHSNLLKYSEERRSADPIKTKIEQLLEESRSLFDISSCKCTSFKKCSCPIYKKVPKNRQKFLSDQRSSRLKSLLDFQNQELNENSVNEEDDFLGENVQYDKSDINDPDYVFLEQVIIKKMILINLSKINFF